MAIYHLEAKIISRGTGRSVVAASAYMSCSKLYNDYDGIEHDYTRKHGLVHQEIMLPANAPPEWADREKLWNAVEEAEKTKDSRLAREFVVALPIELSKDDWVDLLRRYIRDNFVSEGMCADFAIHDTDGHNPHAHIILTVRPLDENGKWQHKTEKEYLCARNGEEQGFTAAEFKSAQKCGWEKQYQYKVGRKKMYMTPSEADATGYERVSKYPKSTKYGRQNPIAERWNSDEQLIKWREAWADAANKILAEKNIDERIDHRSFKERGITEQPTIHEGVTARIMEKEWNVSERCELNRQIRADNRTLRRLKTELQKIAEAVKTSIPKIAKAMEHIFMNLIINCYNQKQAQKVIGQCDDWLDTVKLDYQKYNNLKKETKSKKCLLRDNKSEQKATSRLNISKQISLSKEITTLTEDIEELKSELSSLLLYYKDEAEFKESCSKISDFEEKRKKHMDLQNTFETRINEYTKEFLSLKDKIAPDEEAVLKKEREALHSNTIAQAEEQLQAVYKDKFDYIQFAETKSYLSDLLNEKERDYSIKQRLEQAEEQVKRANSENERYRKEKIDLRR
ncbi:MAG: MobA/MobL family protein [Lachnospiraceae bacterium]|nr:MobA/MobL family protein [Lachnospiraceae bacterium]